jgi:hypothetical protein
MLGFTSLPIRLAEARLRMVHVASSLRLRREIAEDGLVDTTGCVRPFYPKITVFSVLGLTGIIVFYSFACAYKKNPRGMCLLCHFSIFMSHFLVEERVCQEVKFYFNN